MLKDYSRIEIRQFGYYERTQIENILNKCGKDHYLSIVPIKGFYQKKYSYAKIYTKIDDNFVTDVKKGNQIYEKEEAIDDCTYDFINSIPDQTAIHFKDISKLPKCENIVKTIGSVHNKIQHLGFSVVKKYGGTIIIYILANTNSDNKNCLDMTEDLEELAKNIKSKLPWTY